MFDRNAVDMNCMVADINTQWKAALNYRRLQNISHDDVCVINFSRDVYSIYTMSHCVFNKLLDFLNKSGLDTSWTVPGSNHFELKDVSFMSSQVEKLRQEKVKAFINELYECLTTQPSDEEMREFASFQLYLGQMQLFNDLKKSFKIAESQAVKKIM